MKPLAAAGCRPRLVRNLLGGDPAEKLLNRQFTDVGRRDKFLLFALDNDTSMVIHPMLAGRLHYGAPLSRRRVRDALVLTLADGRELCCHDAKDMGQIYSFLPHLPTGADGGRPAVKQRVCKLLSPPAGSIIKPTSQKKEQKMDLSIVAQKALTQPTPAALWELYGYLLTTDVPSDAPIMRIVETAHHYLCDLQSKANARQYSELASLLDIGAVGGVALENLIGGGKEHFVQRFLLGTVSESLMVMASRQYVKGWSAELGTVHSQAAWFLSGQLWTLSMQFQPKLSNDERWERIHALLAPVSSDETPNEVKTVLIGRLFQLLLLAHLLPLLTSKSE